MEGLPLWRFIDSCTVHQGDIHIIAQELAFLANRKMFWPSKIRDLMARAIRLGIAIPFPREAGLVEVVSEPRPASSATCDVPHQHEPHGETGGVGEVPPR
jgi:hypothetical protein